MDVKEKILNEKGQALFEFVIFLPFFIYLFTVMLNITSSINASINQQKASRGYLFQILKGDSRAPNVRDMKDYLAVGRPTLIGPFSVGWREKSSGTRDSFGTCFKFSTFLGSGPTESCDDGPDHSEGTSNYIRVFTFFGVCGANYEAKGSFFHNTEGVFTTHPTQLNQYGFAGCIIQ